MTRAWEKANKLFAMRVRLHDGTLALITAYDANVTDPHTGHMRIDVTCSHSRPHGAVRAKANCTVPVFNRGDTYCAVNRWTAIDSDDAKALVLSLFAMKPGDTDADYFDGYTPEQLAFATRYGEDLSMAAMDRFGER